VAKTMQEVTRSVERTLDHLAETHHKQLEILARQRTLAKSRDRWARQREHPADEPG
jgi:hypothetical protein